MMLNNHENYVALMAFAAFLMVMASAATLKFYSDDWHRKEAAVYSFVAWLLMFGALKHLEREHHKDRAIAETKDASEVFDLARTTDYLLATPSGATISWRSVDGRPTSLPDIQGRGGRDTDADSKSISPASATDDDSGDVREREFTTNRTTGMTQASAEF